MALISVRGITQRRDDVPENFAAGFTGLIERGADDFFVDAVDLEVQLNAGDAAHRAGDLEVHIAVMILVPHDVGQEDERRASLTRPMEIPATGSLMGTPASMSDRVPPHTDAMLLEPLDSRISETTRIV